MPLRQLYPSGDVDDESLVDIVAVHGLNPRSKDDEEHAWDSWRKPAGNNGRIWLKDDLPKGYTAQARIFIWLTMEVISLYFFMCYSFIVSGIRH